MRLIPILLAALAFQAGCSDPFYYRDVQGKVASVGSRVQVAQGAGQERIAVHLNPWTAGDAIGDLAGADGLYVDCVSTKCAALQVGSCVDFDCKRDVRWTEPSIVECKMDRTIDCATIRPRRP